MQQADKQGDLLQRMPAERPRRERPLTIEDRVRRVMWRNKVSEETAREYVRREMRDGAP